MILFVFEGQKDEPKIYATNKALYFEKESEDIKYVFNSNIYRLYDVIMKEYSDFSNMNNAADVVSLLRRFHPESDLKDIEISSDIDQIFFFFDYDFQEVFYEKEKHPDYNLMKCLEMNNHKVQEMLNLFNNETEMGKLYINYPMIESLKFTKRLPDSQYHSYEVTLDECHGKFKGIAEKFTDYHSYHGLLIEDTIDREIVSKNWQKLKEQNIKKANFLCTGRNSLPKNKETISQNRIYQSQLKKYNTNAHIGILNSFPLFLYDYFK